MNETGKTAVISTQAPAPIGPYSQAVKCDGFIFCSGQTPIDPKTGKLVEGDIAVQTRQVLANLTAVLEAAGSGLGRVVKSTIFLTNLADFAVVNKIYGELFPFEPPARSTVQVAALPMGAQVEIEMIAQASTGLM